MSPIASNHSWISVASQDSYKAFHVADGGMRYIVTKDVLGDSDLSDNTSSTGTPFGGTPISLGNGQFWVEYSNLTAETADIKVTAKVGEGVRTIQQSISYSGANNNALHAGNGVALIGTTGTVDGDIEYDNSLLNEFTVTGGIASGGNIPPSAVLQPLIDQTTSTHFGDLTINGNYTGDVRVTGTLTIEGSGTITGVIVSDNDIIINAGMVTMVGTLAAANTIDIQQLTGGTFQPQAAPVFGMNPALIALNDVKLNLSDNNVNVLIQGLVHAGNTVDFIISGDGSNLTHEGAVFASNDVKFETSGSGGNILVDVAAGAAFLNPVVKITNWKEV